jgi:hypothetical protein
MLSPTLLEALRDYWRSLNANRRNGYSRAGPGTPPTVPSLPEPIFISRDGISTLPPVPWARSS